MDTTVLPNVTQSHFPDYYIRKDAYIPKDDPRYAAGNGKALLI